MSARGLAWVALLVMGGCGPGNTFPVLGQVADFTLTAETGKPFASTSLKGHVWVADFIYTNCPGPCPLMSERMRRIQDLTPSAIRLISFSVDPARDTPAVLAAYGRRFREVPARWTLLTGDARTLARLDRDDFKLGTLDNTFSHSTRFVLVDQQGRIRAYYSYGDDAMVQHIVQDAEALAKENS